MKKFVHLLFASVLILSLVQCGPGKDSSGKGDGDKTEKSTTSFPRSETLYLAGFQWGDPSTFNPLSDWPAFPVGSMHNIMYEQLILLNTLNGKIEPLLATLKEQNEDYVSVVVNPEAKWSDGTPLTGADVKYTYEIGQTHKSARTSYVWDYISKITVNDVDEPVSDGGAKNDVAVKSDAGNEEKADNVAAVSAPASKKDAGVVSKVEKAKVVEAAPAGGGDVVKFYVNKKKENNPMVILDFLQRVQIVPKHIFEAKFKAAKGSFSDVQKEMMGKNPVVSGPYNLLNYSAQKIVLQRRDDYWGNKGLYNNRKPAPKFIVHPIFKSNDHFSTALQKGELDVNSNFIPRIWMKKKAGVRTWYDKEPYFVPASIPMLTINTERYPLSDKAYRRAMAFAINYKNVKDLAVSGYSPDLQPGLILPFGTEKKYYSEEDAKKYGAHYDVERAKKILADAGYKSVFKDGKLDHMVDAKGKKVPTLHVRSPAGWSDWESMVKIVVKDLRAAGIDVRAGFCDESLYWECQLGGDFDMLMHTPAASITPSLPWFRFQTVMSSRNWKPLGDKTNVNQGRYNNPNGENYNPRVDELLKQIPHIHDEAAKVKAYRELNVIFMQDQPTLPLVYRPEEFYDFSIKHWTNFATEKNPYAAPQLPCFGTGRNMLWEIKPVK